MLKGVQLTKIHILSHVIAQSVFQPRKDVNVTACKQRKITFSFSPFPYSETINSLIINKSTLERII